MHLLFLLDVAPQVQVPEDSSNALWLALVLVFIIYGAYCLVDALSTPRR